MQSAEHNLNTVTRIWICFWIDPLRLMLESKGGLPVCSETQKPRRKRPRETEPLSKYSLLSLQIASSTICSLEKLHKDDNCINGQYRLYSLNNESCLHGTYEIEERHAPFKSYLLALRDVICKSKSRLSIWANKVLSAKSRGTVQRPMLVHESCCRYAATGAMACHSKRIRTSRCRRWVTFDRRSRWARIGEIVVCTASRGIWPDTPHKRQSIVRSIRESAER